MENKKLKIGNVPNLRFKEFQGEWEFLNGNDIFENISNKNHNSELPILAITQEYGAIPREFIDYKISVTDKSIESYKVVESGDFIISLRSFQGGIEYSSYKGICSPAYIILRSKIQIVDIFFKFYLKTSRYIISLNKNLEGIRDGKMISYKYFSEIPLPFPSISEQQKIASFLSLIEERITTQSKILLHYQSLIQKLRNDIFIKKIRFKDKYGKPFCNWQNKRLKDIAKIFDGTHQTPTYVESGIPFYSVENVTGNNFKDTKFISEEIFQKESNRVIIEKGDILMTRIGDIGTIRLIDWDVCASFYVSLALIKKHQEYNSGYLAHYLATQIFQKELWDRTIHVAFPKKINLGEIGECLVLLPCMEEQNKIASVLSSISTKIDIEAQLLQKLEEQKKFLLQNLFV